MKIAYLMLVHSNPRLQQRAINALSTEDCGFFIHVDAKSDLRQFAGISGHNVSFIEPRIPVYWGEFSIVRATMSLMRQALDCAEDYDYFVFMQGSDYPLRSGRYIQGFFDENRGLEFLSLAKLPVPGYPLSRLEAFRYPSTRPLLRFATRTLGKVGLARRNYRRHLVDLDAYGGDAAWSLSRNACQYIVDFANANPHVEAFFRNTFSAPDEWFFHTILGNSSFWPRCRRTLCYRDFPENSPHPTFIGERHIRLFEAQEGVLVGDEWGSGEVLFARKFSDENMHVMDRIDEIIRQKGESNPPKEKQQPSIG